MTRRRSVHAVVPLMLALVAVLAAPSALAERAVAAARTAAGHVSHPGAFVPLVPSRVLDTGKGVGAPVGVVPAGGTVTLEVAGRGGVPASGVGAVALTVTVGSASRSGYVTVFPSGVSRPGTANVYFPPGESTSNLVVVKVGADGKVKLFNGSSASVRLLADVSGYVVGGVGSDPGAFVPLVPSRVLDTGKGVGAPVGVVPAGGTVTLEVAGRGGVPASGVGAVALTVTVGSASRSGYVTVFPSGVSRPGTANVYFPPGESTSNLVVVKVGADGKVKLFNGASASVRLLADVSGYVVGGVGSDPGAFVPLVPSRVLDTGKGVGAPVGVVPAGGTVTLEVAGRGGVPASGVGAVALTVTVGSASRSGYVTVFPSGVSRPGTANVYFPPGESTSNLVVVKVGADGKVKLFNGASAPVRLLADVSGYVVGATPPPWGAPQLIDRASGEIRALNCWSTTGCLAVDAHGPTFALSADGWQEVAPSGGHGVRDVSCLAPDTCVAVFWPNEVATWSGGRWSARSSLGDTAEQLTAVQCPAREWCVATTSSGRVWSGFGSTWTAADVETYERELIDVSCVSKESCFAISSYRAYRLSDSAWSFLHDLHRQSSNVSCASTVFCVVSAYGGDQVEVMRGDTWESMVIAGMGNGINAASCPTETFCLVRDGMSQASTWNGESWSVPVGVEGWLGELSCPTSATCHAVIDGTGVAQFANGTWSSPDVIAPNQGLPIDVSCASSTFCTLIDANGASVTYSGDSWRAPQATQTERAWPLSAISCVDPAFCVAVTDYRLTGNGNLLTFDGSAWSQTTGQFAFVDVECTSRSWCMALRYYGPTLVFDGHTWTEGPNVNRAGFFVATDLDCVSPTFCAAVDNKGRASTFNGTVWSEAYTVVDASASPGQRSVACAAPTMCVMVDDQGRASSFTGNGWSPLATVDADGDGLRGVSCAGTTFCVAVDAKGRALTYTGTWGPPATIDPAGDLTAVSCPSEHFCAVVGRSGNAVLMK